MPKLSVSIPDELWEDARRHAGGEPKASQVVQSALRLYVADRPSEALAPKDLADPVRFQEVLAGLLDGYRAEYKRGYEDGLRFAELAGFEPLALIARHGFDLGDSWDMLELPEGDETPGYWWLTAFFDEFDGVDGAPINTVFLDGATRAVKDVWEAVKAAGRQSIAESPAGKPSAEEPS